MTSHARHPWPSTPVHTMAHGATAPAIAALHGFTGRGGDFDGLIAHSTTAATWRCPDLPGHGDTPAMDWTAFQSDLGRWIESLPRPRILLGYSLGGRCALAFASAHADRIDGLVLVGAHPGLVDATERDTRAAADSLLADTARREGLDTFLSRWRRQPLIASQENAPEPWLGHMRKARTTHRIAELATILESWSPGRLPPQWDRLQSLRLPVLLLTGANDARYTALAARMSALMPAATHRTVPACGHACHLEAPAPTAGILDAWLATLGS